MRGVGEQIAALQRRHQADGQLAGVSVSPERALGLHPPETGRKQFLPGPEKLSQANAGLLVLIGQFARHRPEGAAVSPALQRVRLNQGIAPAGQPAERVQPP
jgi:hypothetical protein